MEKDKLTDNEKDFLNWMQNTTNEYRGKFTNQAIVIEQIIDEFLSYYFVPDKEKQLQFRQLILNSIDMTFSQKIKMFEEITKKFLPSDFDKYKTLHKKVDKLRKKRNDFAHSKIDSRKENISSYSNKKDSLYLLKLEKYEIKSIIWKTNDLEKELDEYWELTLTLNEMLGKLLNSIKALPS